MKTVLLKIIRFYQLFISPITPPSCRFYPTCSDYSYHSIQAHGIIKGGWYSIKRVGKCHPFHPGGFDPVKENKQVDVNG
ncbi:MAG: membrane protein insertion efficiency factor YidD [Caldithrix sp.]|nr:membrane protein insertion efficiency factor YidD [Caldithrix sp.]